MSTEHRPNQMDEFESALHAMNELTEDTTQELREKLLDALDFAESWSLVGESAEPCVDGSGDWELFTLSHDVDPDQCVTVFVLPGSHNIQTYLEPAGVFTEPSQETEYIQTALSD